MTEVNEELLGRLKQTLAAERAAWPYGDSGDFVAHRAALRDVLEIYQEVGCQGDFPMIVESEIAWLGNELDYHSPSPTQITFLESALDNLCIVRELSTEVMDSVKYAFANWVFRSNASRLGAVPNDQIRQALTQHLVHCL